MSDLCRLIWCAIVGRVRSRAALQVEILVLRHQLNVLRRKSPKRVTFGNIDRLLFVEFYRFSPKVLEALKNLKPETVLRWHRSDFRAYWRWKSRSCGGGAGRRNKAGGAEGVVAARQSADVAGRQARVPATLGCENGTRARKREQIEW
jgi:hypothetical protein